MNSVCHAAGPVRTAGLRRTRPGAWPALLALAFAPLVGGCSARETRCRAVDVDAAWRSYAAGRIDDAYESFARAVERCPSYSNGQLGLGYAALRRGELELAGRMFDAVLDRQPDSVDALVGSGLVYWRQAAYEPARQRFERAFDLDPRHAEARAYLARFPAYGDAERPGLALPDTLVYTARVVPGGFEIRGEAGWLPFYVQGVNIGAAQPGRHPSEFPDSATYANWFRLIGAMDANTVRVYTMHPPHFYEALLDYNRAHPDAPLWLLHGVWAELPPGDTAYDDAAWNRAFHDDMRTVVDIIYGRADLPLHPGRTSGHYTADVAAYTLGFVLGREWEAHSVAGYNETATVPTAWAGEYVEVSGATPMDVWLARAIDAIVAYETATYGSQRPVAYTNWPPTDPLYHVTEPDLLEERAIRRALGDTARFTPVRGGSDAVTLDPTLIRARPAFPAGYFAAYHVYPYYPDFMVLDPDYGSARSPWGPSNYWGYLTRLKQQHSDLPILIAEYGVPASIGIAHFQPQGWHHGGHSEARAAEINARLTREIAAAGMAGGLVFAWIDEWFKNTWSTEPYEVPRERGRLWHNRMDPEEHYGILAAEPGSPISGRALAERQRSWRLMEPLLSAADGTVLRAAADEAYLSLYIELGGEARAPDELLIGLDLLDAASGEFRWPDGVGAALPIGLEFVVSVTPQRAQLLVHPPVNPVRIGTLDFTPPGEPASRPELADTAPGFFRGRYLEVLARRVAPRVSRTGEFEARRVLAHRIRFGRDSTEYSALGYDAGVLPAGPLPDGLWEWRDGAIEVRVPWQLLNVADPSQRRVLNYETPAADGAEHGTVAVPGVRILLGVRRGTDVRTWPTASSAAAVPLFAWDTWEAPRWTMRMRPSYWSIREAWQEIGRTMAAAAPRGGGR